MGVTRTSDENCEEVLINKCAWGPLRKKYASSSSSLSGHAVSPESYVNFLYYEGVSDDGDSQLCEP